MPPETSAEPQVCSLSPDGSPCNCSCPPSHRRARNIAYGGLAIMLAAVLFAVAYLLWTALH